MRHEPRWRRAASPAETGPAETGSCEALPCEADREREDDDDLPKAAPLAQRIDRLKAIIEGAGAPEPEPGLRRAERRALAAQRAERARRAASPAPPDEPWDILTTTDRPAGEDPPWRSSG